MRRRVVGLEAGTVAAIYYTWNHDCHNLRGGPMSFNRRFFLVAVAVLANTVAVARGEPPARPLKPLKILVLGGTGFLGPATIEYALARGHKVTMFNRGKTRPELFPNVEKLQGDRDPKKGKGLKALETGQWDVVIDNSTTFRGWWRPPPGYWPIAANSTS